MKKSSAFILALLITLIVFSNYFLLNSLQNKKIQIVVSRAIDGDTFVSSDGQTYRLLNINTPEKSEEGYAEAKSFLQEYENKTIEIELFGEDLYGRILVRAYAPEYLNLKLVENGLAKKFLVEEDELQLYDKTEENAVEGERGIWKKSEYSECVSAEIDEKSEIISLKNLCPINFMNWEVKDESRKKYKFQNISFREVKLHSAAGTDNESDIFWNSAQNIWNNDRDTFYLFDSQGNIVLHISYGY